jgi:hypothetical protein
VSLTYRWLGAAGLVITAGSQALAVDPFFTRPSILEMLGPIKSDPELVREKLPACNYVLVTHSHYDHLMDVPEVVHITDAVVYGSPNACQISASLGVAVDHFHAVGAGAKLSLGQFEIEVVSGQHSPIPFSYIFNAPLTPGAKPPRYAWDYKMDVCLGYCITVQGVRFLVCALDPRPADVLFVVAQEPKDYYQKMVAGVRPKILVPIHWDNFTRSLKKPLRKFTRPGRMSLARLTELVHQLSRNCIVTIPELFKDYSVEG